MPTLYGITISSGQFGLMFTALDMGLPTGLAALMLQMQVFFTVPVAGVLLREPVPAHHLPRMPTTAAGLVFIGIGHYRDALPFASLLPVPVLRHHGLAATSSSNASAM